MYREAHLFDDGVDRAALPAQLFLEYDGPEDPRVAGYLLPHQPIGKARAVVVFELVMDCLGRFPVARHGGYDHRADGRVLAVRGPERRGQVEVLLARHAVRQADLAYLVQEGGKYDLFALFVRKLEFFRDEFDASLRIMGAVACPRHAHLQDLEQDGRQLLEVSLEERVCSRSASPLPPSALPEASSHRPWTGPWEGGYAGRSPFSI